MTVQKIKCAKGLPQPNDVVYGFAERIATTLICEAPALRAKLRHTLSGTGFVVTEETFTSGQAPARDLAGAPRLFIINVAGWSGRITEMVRSLKGQYPEARVVALADHYDIGFAQLARDAGVNGFCLTTSGQEVLIKSLELVMLGETVLPSAMVRSILVKMALKAQLPSHARSAAAETKLPDPRACRLSAREAEILGCLMDGAPNKVIARQLCVTEATVKVHVKAILRKIGAANRTQAAMWATEHLPETMKSFHD
jgi:two-component system, NarL family, nitrate/nitrite response regulator NarL